jgi:hypothetical protein
MPKNGWVVITIRQEPHDLARKFLDKVNKGKHYQKEKVSLADFAGVAIVEKIERDRDKELAIQN